MPFITSGISNHDSLAGVSEDDHHDLSHASRHSLGGADILPNIFVSGLILMWHGTIANIPAGFVICDGQNNTPDLRDRFVIGSPNAVDPGSTGGAATHSHAAHDNHIITQADGHAALGTHAHSSTVMNLSGAPSGIAKANFGQGVEMTATYEVSTSASSEVDTAHLTNAVSAGTPDAHSGADVDAHSAHGDSNAEPPFFEILFIMFA